MRIGASGDPERKGYRKDCSLAEGTLHADRATMGIGDLAHNCQAQPCPAGGTATRAIPAVEALEDMRQMFGRNALAGVADGDRAAFLRPAVGLSPLRDQVYQTTA